MMIYRHRKDDGWTRNKMFSNLSVVTNDKLGACVAVKASHESAVSYVKFFIPKYIIYLFVNHVPLNTLQMYSWFWS